MLSAKCATWVSRPFTGGISAEINDIFPAEAEGDATPGFSNQNTILSQTDYQPFTVSALPDALSQQPDPSSIARTVEFGGAGDTANPGAQGLPVNETDYLAGGATRVTTYGNYKLGKPQTTAVSIQLAGSTSAAQTSVTRSFVDDHGNVVFSFDALGQGTEYNYDGQGNLTETWQVANWSTINPATFNVNDSSTWPAKLTSQPQSQNVYYGAGDTSPGAYPGQVQYSFDASRQQSAFAYDSMGNQVLAYKLCRTPGQPDCWVGTTTTYDADGRPLTTTNNTYTAAANPDNTYSLPTAAILGGATPQQSLQTSGTDYTPAGQTDTTTDQYGKQTKNLYDVNNNVVQTSTGNGVVIFTVVRSIYDSMQRVIWRTDPFDPNSSAPVLATHTIYNSLGQVSATERYSGTDIQVSTSGAISTSTLESAGTKIFGTSTIYNAQGQVAESTNAAGLRTGNVYYSDGEVQYTGPLNTVADPATGATVAPVGGPYSLSDFASHTQYEYNRSDSSAGPLYDRVTDADGHNTDTYKDLLGRTTKTVFDDGSFTETLYSVSGAAIPDYYVSGTALPTIPAGGSEKVEIAQRKAGDPIVATIYLSDASGNLTDVYQPPVLDSNPASPTYGQMVRPHTGYTYDESGDELTQTDANNDTTDFTYDQNGNEVARTLPDGEEESFTYNINGQEATHTDFDGNVATYSYLPASDPNAGSLYQVVYVGADSSKPTETVTYTYTNLGQQATISDSAEATAADPTGTTTLSYDPEGDVTVQDTPEGIIHHAFDPATGELIETWTAYTDIAYGYNTLGELTTTTVKELNGQELTSPLVTTDTYDPAGNKATETLPNGVVTSWTDDDLNRLVAMSETLNGTTLFSQTFTLNDDGTRASSHQTQLQANGSTTTTHTTWSNDALGRLTSEVLSSSDASQDYTDTFTYDLVGNRLTSTHTGPGAGPDENVTNTYNGDDELTKEVSSLSGETDLTYDPNGSLTSSGPPSGPATSTYAYDVRNKMITATVDGVATAYVYDDAGNRVGETTGGVTTFYLTDDNNPTGYAQPIEQKASAAAAPSVTYIIGDRVLGQADASDDVSYLLTDGHGSTRALTNSTGAVTQTFNYTAFGGAIGFNPATAGTVFLFAGDAVYDPASGLYLHGDGTRPRDGFFFTQMDSSAGNASDPLSLHKYLYADANPANAIDPTGMFSVLNGLSAQAQILRIYKSDHPAQAVVAGFGKPTSYIFGLAPDIQNCSTSRWLEVKPLTPGGVSDAAISIQKYAWFAVLGWLPDASWTPSKNLIYLNGRQEPFVNAGGIVFYGDEVELDIETILATELLLARSVGMSRILFAAQSGVRATAADNSYQSDVGPSVASLVALL
jgi:YD repeat-containing protein